MNDPRQLGESITDVYFESNHITNADKLALMHGAMSDPLFLADIEEINEDFR